MAEKKKNGRPTSYRKEYDDIALAMLSDDAPVCAVCGELGIHEETFTAWVAAQPSFSEAVKKGKALGKARFLSQVKAAAWDSQAHRVNNGLINLLAINKYRLVTANSQSKDEVNQSTTIKHEIPPEIRDMIKISRDPEDS